MKKIFLISAICVLSACGIEGDDGAIGSVETQGDSKHTNVALEGEQLAYELANSPARLAPVPFVRLGAVWDATAASSLEISISDDGESWTSWQSLAVVHIEAELDGSFVGRLDAPDSATFYRLRSVGKAPTFVSLNFFESTLSEQLEDGDDASLFFDPGLELANATVNNRASWGARAARCVSAHSPFRLTVHHTVTPTNDSLSPQARLRQIQSFHQDVNGWCDVGYHFLVSRDGRLWEGRPSGVIGSHVGGANSGNVGISFMGTHTSTPITDGQLDNVAGLIADVTDQYGIGISSANIKGHRDRGQTSCPGDALYAQLPRLIDRAKNGGGPIDPPPPVAVNVRGIIYEGSDTSARVAGATVTVGDLEIVSDSNGYYELDNVPAGTYDVTVRAGGFVTRTISREVSGDITWASVGLSRDLPVGTATLQGVIYTGSSSSNRVADVTIQLSTGHSLVTDSNGFYRIGDLPAGPVTITASKAGFSTRSIDRTLAGSTTTWGSLQLQ